MNRETFRHHHRTARMGNLGPLCMSTSRDLYRWLLSEVYDLRFPHVGDSRHLADHYPTGFNNLRNGGRTRAAYESFHRSRGWINCGHKSLLRLWSEFKAMGGRL